MLELLLSFDRLLFSWLNGAIANPVFDVIMPVMTDLAKIKPVVVVFALVLLALLVKGGARGRWAVLVLALTITVSDQLNSSFAKQLFARPRPCHELQELRLLVDCGGGKSFPSSHAVNNFAGMFVLAFFYPKYKRWFFALAATVAFSRVYVGVHYPFDILAGSLFGLGIGWCMIALSTRLERRVPERWRFSAAPNESMSHGA